MIRFITYVMFLIVLLAPSSFAAGNPTVTFLNPGGEDDAFFGMMTSFMQAAADDLNIELEVIYCDRDHFKLQEEGGLLLKRDELPEYLILINEKNSVPELLRTASRKGIKVALINEGLKEKFRREIGGPGDTLHNWLFELLPDDRMAGYLLAKALISAARNTVNEKGRLYLSGISGSFQTGSSSSRVQGLKDAMAEYNDVHLQQIVPAYWQEDKARKVTMGLLERYPNTTIIWSASDLMARGALKAGIESYDHRHAKLITGGIDWAEFALKMVESGMFAATVGGHFMDGAWALVMLYDYHNGIPLETKSIMSPFSVITRENVDAYLDHFGEHNWAAIDFRKFSKKLNPQLTSYTFGLTPVMEQLQDK